jgi:hypothetical protein
MPDDLDATLDGFRSLKVGWDSYKAEPPSEKAIGAVRAFLPLLRAEWREPDRLRPSSVGGIGLTFYRDKASGSCSIYVEFLNHSDKVLAIQLGEREVRDRPVIVHVGCYPEGVRTFTAWAREYLGEAEAPHA